MYMYCIYIYIYVLYKIMMILVVLIMIGEPWERLPDTAAQRHGGRARERRTRSTYFKSTFIYG